MENQQDLLDLYQMFLDTLAASKDLNALYHLQGPVRLSNRVEVTFRWRKSDDVKAPNEATKLSNK